MYIPDEHDGVLLVDGTDRCGDSVSSALSDGQPSAAARESREHGGRSTSYVLFVFSFAASLDPADWRLSGTHVCAEDLDPPRLFGSCTNIVHLSLRGGRADIRDSKDC